MIFIPLFRNKEVLFRNGLIDAMNVTTEEYDLALKGLNFTALGLEECSLSKQLDEVR